MKSRSWGKKDKSLAYLRRELLFNASIAGVWGEQKCDFILYM